MPKKFIQRYFPDKEKIKNHKYLKCFGSLLHNSNLWHFNRKSVSGAFAVGLFCAFIPVPFQMVIAAAGAILFRVNMPVSIGLVWITNPITMPPMFYFAYKVGAWVMDIPTRTVTFELSFDWLMQELGAIWQPFLLGCVISGVLLSVCGYLLIQLLWRLHIIRSIKQRRARRKLERASRNK